MAMSDLVSLKITINNDANYLLFGDRICRDVKELDEFCKSRFQDLQKKMGEFRYFWIDGDGDEIRVSTDEDYRSFLQAMANTKARLYVVEKKTMSAERGIQDEIVAVQAEAEDDAPMQNDATGVVDSSRPLHQQVICDVCDEEIVGHRYKCLTCHDYDLCMSCEAKFRHKDHLMLRIPKPALVCRSQAVVARMFDKLRMYSARIISNAEKDGEPEVSSGPGNDGTTDASGMKRANARSGHRSKHSEERRTNTELLKSSRGAKTIGCADRKQNCAATETCAGTKATKEKASLPTVSEMTQRCRDVMVMYMNAQEALDSTGNPVPWSTSDHITVANLAAATATAAATRAKIIANKIYASKPDFKLSSLAEPTPQEMEQVLRNAKAQKTVPTTAPPPSTVMPIPFLPFVNLTWPSQEKLMVASENVSKLLDPLGLSFEIRHKSAGAPSTLPGGSPKTRDAPVPSASDVPVSPVTLATVAKIASSQPTAKKQEDNKEPLDKKQENPIQAKDPQHMAAVVAESSNAIPEPNAVSEKPSSSEKEVQKDPSTGALLESDSVSVDKAEAAVENEPDDEDDSQNTSSASLLTDDDQDLLEVDEEGKENSFSPSKPPKATEKSWTLVDIPHEHDEVKIPANVPLDAIAKLIGHNISSTTDKEEPAQQLTPLLHGKEMKKDKPAPESKLKDTKKIRKIIVEQKEESEPGHSATMKEIKTPPTISGPASSTASSSAPSSSAAGRSGKSSRKPSSAQKDVTIYSHRPHVNHAIHTMMTMGFSNHNGWLTQLLESLNGDIPKALDLLLQHRH